MTFILDFLADLTEEVAEQERHARKVKSPPPPSCHSTTFPGGTEGKWEKRIPPYPPLFFLHNPPLLPESTPSRKNSSPSFLPPSTRYSFSSPWQVEKGDGGGREGEEKEKDEEGVKQPSPRHSKGRGPREGVGRKPRPEGKPRRKGANYRGLHECFGGEEKAESRQGHLGVRVGAGLVGWRGFRQGT